MCKVIYHIDGYEYDEVPYADFISLADKTYRMTYALSGLRKKLISVSAVAC